jgi:hypothetical protein
MKKAIYLVLFTIFCTYLMISCVQKGNKQIKSDSGVTKATATVTTDADGTTVEQRNYKERIRRDNLPGSIKHLYVISAYSGQIIIYSTVRGKVTSASKRLTPSTAENRGGGYTSGFPISIGNWTGSTTEILGDDGTYGPSDPYIYWYDTRDVYHQHYITGGQIIHISDQPLAVKSIIINMELK